MCPLAPQRSHFSSQKDLKCDREWHPRHLRGRGHSSWLCQSLHPKLSQRYTLEETVEEGLQDLGRKGRGLEERRERLRPRGSLLDPVR